MEAKLNKKEIAENITIKLDIDEAKVFLRMIVPLYDEKNNIIARIYNAVTCAVGEAEKL